MASNRTSSDEKGCGKTIAIVGGIVALIAGLITIVQYFTGKPTFTALFEGTAVVTQATPTDNPTLMPTPTLAPKVISTPTSTPASPVQSSFTPIVYGSFWTWFWWAIIGAFFWSLGMFIDDWIARKNAEYRVISIVAGTILGSGFGAFCGIISSFFLNLFHAPYAFLISIWIICILSGIMCRLLAFGEEKPKKPDSHNADKATILF